jgi:hypothetical protein
MNFITTQPSAYHSPDSLFPPACFILDHVSIHAAYVPPAVEDASRPPKVRKVRVGVDLRPQVLAVLAEEGGELAPQDMGIVPKRRGMTNENTPLGRALRLLLAEGAIVRVEHHQSGHGGRYSCTYRLP